MQPIDVEDFVKNLNQKVLRINNNNNNFNFMENTKHNFMKLTNKKRYINDSQYKRIKEKYEDEEEEETIKTNTDTDFILDKQEIERKINTADIPKVMKLMLKMMLKEHGHNHEEFREAVCYVLKNGLCEVENILDHKNYDSKTIGKMAKWKDDKLKKLWARYLFDTYTMLCTKIANNFIRYDKSFPEDTSYPDLSISKKEPSDEKPYIKEEGLVEGGEYIVKKGLLIRKEKANRMHVNKLGAIDVLNDKKKITNILRDFYQGKEYLATRGNWYLPGAHVPDKVEYGTLINDLNASITKFAGQLLKWRKNELLGSETLKTIMNEMDGVLSGILNNVDVDMEKEKRSSTIRQPWNKACNLKKCVQFFYSNCKPGNNVITGQFFSGKNSRSGKLKYKKILNSCIEDLMNLENQKKEIIVKKLY